MGCTNSKQQDQGPTANVGTNPPNPPRPEPRPEAGQAEDDSGTIGGRTQSYGAAVGATSPTLAAPSGANPPSTENNSVVFILNKTEHVVVNPDPTLLLVDYLRDNLGMTGTKRMCKEGGCGCCTVMEERLVEGSDQVRQVPINSCLRPVCSLDGLSIRTADTSQPKDSLQKVVEERIVNPKPGAACASGTQCGYCTPGMVMTAYSLLSSPTMREKLTKDPDGAFAGNICRCTGFFPIIEALDATLRTVGTLSTPSRDSTVEDSLKTLQNHRAGLSLHYTGHFAKKDYAWFRPTSLVEALELLKKHYATPFDPMLVAGYTSTGIFKRENDPDKNDPKTMIDISDLPELRALSLSEKELVVGAGITYQEMHMYLTSAEVSHHDGQDIQALAEALHSIAGEQVRARATVGGCVRLMQQRGCGPGGFPSDLTPVLLALNATVTLANAGTGRRTTVPLHSLDEGKLVFLNEEDWKMTIIVSIQIPRAQPNAIIKHYRIARRLQNSHALVNACFAASTTPCEGGVRLSNVAIWFGCVAQTPLRAIAAETVLEDAILGETCLQAALEALSITLPKVAPDFEDSIPRSYRQHTMLSLFFRFYVHLCNTSKVQVPPFAVTAGEDLLRESATGTSKFHENPLLFPMTEAIPKNTAASQASGKLLYTDDYPLPANAMFATIVKSPVGNATVTYSKVEIETSLRDVFGEESFDTQSYFDAEDFPEAFTNGFASNGDKVTEYPPMTMDWPHDPFLQKSGADVTCDGHVIGIVVANDRRTALAAARFVQQNCMQFAKDEPTIGFGDTPNMGPPRRKLIVAVENEHPLTQTWKNDGQNPEGSDKWPQDKFGDFVMREKSDQSWLLRKTRTVDDNKDFSVVEGQQRCGLQTHFYMELWAVHAIPNRTFDGNDTIQIRLSAQSPDEVAEDVAKVLEIPKARCRVLSGHLGGGFGGKTTRCKYMAVPIARAAWLLNRPVALVNELDHDITVIGNRHAYLGNYRVCFDKEAKEIKGYQSKIFSIAGNTLDCSSVVLTCALYTQDGAYNIPTFGAEGRMCFTNQTSNTAMRSFGMLQSTIIVEDAISYVANEMGISPEDLRERHLYEAGDKAAYGAEMLDCGILRDNWRKCKESSNIDARREKIKAFNAANRWKKRGIAMIPIKYGCMYEAPFLNYGMALVAVQDDGSVNVHTGGVEMGQGIQVKQQQIAARVLGIPKSINKIRINDVDTNIAAGATSTGSDSGADLNGWSTFFACTQIRLRLVEWLQSVYKSRQDKTKSPIEKLPADDGWWGEPERWEENFITLVQAAKFARVDLASHAFYKVADKASEDSQWADLAKNHPYAYYTYSVGCVEVEIDVLTGQTNVLQADIVFDAGNALNPMVDLGQVQGAFIQGLGYVLTEEMLYTDDGAVFSNGTWEYKPPCSKTIPQVFNATLADESDGSKSARARHLFPEFEFVVAMDEIGSRYSAADLQIFGAITKAIKLKGHTGEEANEMFVDAVGSDDRLQHVNTERLKVALFNKDEIATEKVLEGAFAALHSAKNVGEPPCVMGAAVLMAVKQAVLAARNDKGETGWFTLEAPCTPARIQEACLVSLKDLHL